MSSTAGGGGSRGGVLRQRFMLASCSDLDARRLLLYAWRSPETIRFKRNNKAAEGGIGTCT